MAITPAAIQELERSGKKAKEQRYQDVLTALKNAGTTLDFADAQVLLDEIVVHPVELTRFRITYLANQNRIGQDTPNTQCEDMLTLPLHRMTGPYVLRKAREQIKKEDQWIDGRGQKEGDVSLEQDRKRKAEEKRQVEAFKHALDTQQWNQALTFLDNIIEYMLLNWDTRDRYILAFFDYVADVIIEHAHQSKKFLRRLLEADTSRENAHSYYMKAKTVLYELWNHLSQNKKDLLRKSFESLLTEEELQSLGNPLHQAAFDNDPGTFVVLLDLGVKLDTLNDNKHPNKGYHFSTAFENIFDMLIFYTHQFSIKVFVHYIDEMLQRIENQQGLLVAATYDLEEVRSRMLAINREQSYTIISSEENENLYGRLFLKKWFRRKIAGYKQEFYGAYQGLRRILLTAMEPAFVNQSSSIALLNKGEFKIFMYLKWLGHINISSESELDVKEFYIRPCFGTGNTYLHYLVSHWDDPEHVSSQYERQMRLSAIEHVLAICGDKARFAKNKAGKTPIDLCQSSNLRQLLRYYHINLAGTTREAMLSFVTFEPEAARSIPRGLTSDSMQLVERILAEVQAYGRDNQDKMSPLEIELIVEIKQFIHRYLKDIVRGDQDHDAGDLIIVLYNKMNLNGQALEDKITFKDRALKIFGQHLTNKLEKLFEILVEQKGIEHIGVCGLEDQSACCETNERRRSRQRATDTSNFINADMGRAEQDVQGLQKREAQTSNHSSSSASFLSMAPRVTGNTSYSDTHFSLGAKHD